MGARSNMKSKFSLAYKVKPILELARKTGHKILAAWAIDCVERVLPYFEEKYPQDRRPRKALERLRAWIDTGVFKMADIRGASLAAHAAAREAEEGPARSAARAAGQAVATAHVPTHSVAAAQYALQAVFRAGLDVDREREWQYQHLVELRSKA
ncbi:MAG: hypothetical protein JXB14_00500 [Candidatus Altiarchaeota archaeon]|nr:hypothetical protein [Candidatus Altiarchaeota archaeon]